MPHSIPTGHQPLTNGYTNGHVNGIINGHANTHVVKKLHVDGFSTRAVHVGSDPDEATGAVIPAISLSTTYKQSGVGNHKVRYQIYPFQIAFIGLNVTCAGL
jgi:cystathionine gamma-lyase